MQDQACLDAMRNRMWQRDAQINQGSVTADALRFNQAKWDMISRPRKPVMCGSYTYTNLHNTSIIMKNKERRGIDTVEIVTDKRRTAPGYYDVYSVYMKDSHGRIIEQRGYTSLYDLQEMFA